MKRNKKHFAVIVIYWLLTIALVSATTINNINISQGWRFKTGDNNNFSKPDFNVKDWDEIATGTLWEACGYPNYDGIAYYRLSVVIPSTLKNDNSYIKGILLQLGRIDDDDITYFNGTEIGRTIGYNINRKYIIPFKLINWDKENIIVVRVADNGGDGGMYWGNYSLGLLNNINEVVSMTDNNMPIYELPMPDSTIHQTLKLKTISCIDKIPVFFKVSFIDINSNTIVAEIVKNIVIGVNADSTVDYSFKLPKIGWYKAKYSIFSDFLTDSVKKTVLIAARIEKHLGNRVVKPLIDNYVPSKSIAFDLSNIQLTGYLGSRINANITERLLNIDEKGILECFYNRPGNQTWVGEYAGKYLHAAARAWRYSSNEQLKTQMDRVADILIASQLDNGYLGTYLPNDYWTEWDVWAHKYDLLGLLSYYSVTGYQPALQTSIKIGDLMCKTFGTYYGQINIEETGSHVGMASCSILEPMTDLYRFTGNKRYLDFCNYIIEAYEHPRGAKIISTLNTIGKVDKTGNGKAYEMMSNFTGIVKLYQLTANPKLLSAMERAWNDVATYKLYITGTCSRGEHFQDDFVLPATNDVRMGEGCVTTTWLQFSQTMYNLTGEQKYIDEIEKTIYNHLFAAENPQTGCVSYYTALQGQKPYRCSINGHCCLASIPRGIAAIPELAFTKSATSGFFINLYSSGKFSDSIVTAENTRIPIKLTVETNFPETGTANLNISAPIKARYTIALRVPVWCKNFEAKVNSQVFKGIPGQYLNILQTWEPNTNIQVSFNLTEQVLDGGFSYPNYVAFKTEAQVLAIDGALNPEINDLDKVEVESTSIEVLPSSVLPKSWFGNQIFGLKAKYNEKPVIIKLVPFAEAGQTNAEVRVWLKKKGK